LHDRLQRQKTLALHDAEGFGVGQQGEVIMTTQSGIRFTVLFAFAFVSFPSAATEIFPHIKCPSCTAEQMRAQALALRPNSPGVFSVHVYSLPTGEIRLFEVECIKQDAISPAESSATARTDTGVAGQTDAQSAATGCNGQRLISELPVALEKSKLVAALHDVYVETGGTMKSSVILSVDDLPPYGSTGRPSVYDLAASNPLRIAYATLIMQPVLDANSGANALAEAGLAWLGVSDGMTLSIVLVTREGGQIQYEWKPPADKPVYVEGSAVTAGGQYVPDSDVQREIANGQWTQQGPNGNYDDLREFADHLRRMGFPIYRGDRELPTGTVIPGPVTRITCNEMPDGRFLCKIEVLP
jgi:hypothetical protein